MRVREIGDTYQVAAPHITTWDIRNPSNIVDLGPYAYGYTSRSSRIVDDPKKQWIVLSTGRRRLIMKPVTHQVWVGQSDHGVTTFQTSPYNYQVNNGLQLLAGFTNTSNPKNVPSGEGDLALSKALSAVPANMFADHWDRAKPSMATRASLSVFLYELRDIRRMFELLPGKHLVGNGHALTSWSEVLRYLNGQHLNYNFGWKPFLGDLKAAFKALSSFDSRLQKFISSAGKDLTRHSRTGPYSGEGEEDVATSFTPFRVRRTWSYNLAFGSTFDFAYTLPGYSEQEMRWRVWLDSLGLDVGAATIWAILPWSFVVDWFVDIGGLLSSYSNDWVEPEIELQQACHSVKVEVSMTTTVYTTYSGSTDAVITHLTYYTRKVGIPNFSLSTDPLDADKIRLGSSLLLSVIR